MAGSDKKWVSLASVFPATLNTETDPTRLADGQTPDAWGMDIDHPGYLATGTAPVGTSPIAKTYTISAVAYNWYFKRLWRASSANLLYGAPEYTAIYLPQDIGVLSFDEDSNSLVTFFPFGGDRMFVAKSTGGYQVLNASSFGGNFQHLDIVPSMKVSTAGMAVELDGIAYVSNSSGVFAWAGAEVSEITLPVRTILSRYAGLYLFRDEQKRRVIGGSESTSSAATTKVVYDPGRKGIYDYTQSGFRFTSRTLQSRSSQNPAEKPFIVDKLGFFYENTTQSDHTITVQVKRDQDWEDPVDIPVSWSDDNRTWKEFSLDTNFAARNFTMRITSLSNGLYIKSISVNTDLPTQSEQSWSQ